MSNDSTAIARREAPAQSALVRTWADAKDLARAYAVSGLRTSKGGNENQRTAEALVKIEYGAELGIGPMAAIASIHVIEGKPSISATMWAARVDSSPDYDYEVTQHDDAVCIIDWFKRGKRRGSSRFSIEDAKRAGLLGKDNWKKYPMDMLFARAFMSGARRYAPAVGMGGPMYDPDELEVVGGSAEPSLPAPQQPGTEDVDADFEPVDEGSDEPPDDRDDSDRHAQRAEAAAEQQRRREYAKSVAVLLEPMSAADISQWVDDHEDEIEATLPERNAEALYGYIDGMIAHRSGHTYEGLHPGDVENAEALRELAGLPAIDFANPPDPVGGDDASRE